MNDSNHRMTLQQERLAYRRALELTLQRIFDLNLMQAKALVMRWWEGMQGTVVFKTGFFLHNEVLNTAAELAHSNRTPAIKEVADLYNQILRESLPVHRTRRAQKPGTHRRLNGAKAA